MHLLHWSKSIYTIVADQQNGCVHPLRNTAAQRLSNFVEFQMPFYRNLCSQTIFNMATHIPGSHRTGSRLMHTIRLIVSTVLHERGGYLMNRRGIDWKMCLLWALYDWRNANTRKDKINNNSWWMRLWARNFSLWNSAEIKKTWNNQKHVWQLGVANLPWLCLLRRRSSHPWTSDVRKKRSFIMYQIACSLPLGCFNFQTNLIQLLLN